MSPINLPPLRYLLLGGFIASMLWGWVLTAYEQAHRESLTAWYDHPDHAKLAACEGRGAGVAGAIPDRGGEIHWCSDGEIAQLRESKRDAETVDLLDVLAAMLE